MDGRRLTERHVDGGVTQNVFIRPPQVPPEYLQRPPADFLFGSDMYVVVAGKLFADAAAVKPRTLRIAIAGVSTSICAETRAELVKLYAMSMVTGMNYHLAALPQDFKVSADGSEFDPVEMGAMFEEGRRQALSGTAWRNRPPEIGDGEGVTQRAGTRPTRVPAGSTKGKRGDWPTW